MGLLEEMNEKVIKELNRKEESITKKHDELDVKIRVFIQELKQLKIESIHTYKLKEQVEISKLQNQISKFSDKLGMLTIPEKIELKTRKHIQFEDGTKRFLWLYFCFSVPVLALCVYFGVNGVTIEKNDIKSYRKGLGEGVKSGRVEIYNSLPGSSQKYLDNKFPESYFWR